MNKDNLNAIGAHCPRCGQEYRPGFAECADCRVALHPGPAPAGGNWAEPGLAEEEESEAIAVAEAARSDQRGPLARVGGYTRREAILVAGMLENEGIAVSFHPSSPYAPPMTGYGELLDPQFEVLVPEDRMDEARALIEGRPPPRHEGNGW